MMFALHPIRAAVVAVWASWAAGLPDAVPERAGPAAAAVLDLVDERGPLPGLDAAETTHLLLAWSHRESRWRADVVGGLGDCGVLQVRAPWRWVEGATCEAVARDIALGYAVGYEVMRHEIERCGSVRAGLGAYATGRCGGAPGLVGRRCRAAGLGVQCKAS